MKAKIEEKLEKAMKESSRLSRTHFIFVQISKTPKEKINSPKKKNQARKGTN